MSVIRKAQLGIDSVTKKLKWWDNRTGRWHDVKVDNGGSQPVLKDLGIVNYTDLLSGTVTLYIASANERVGPVYLEAVSLPDVDAMGVSAGPDGTSGFADFLAAADPNFGIANGLVINTANVLQLNLATGPIKAGFAERTNYPIAGAWLANHDYTPDPGPGESFVLGGGHLWFTADSGLSGGTEPDWASNFGGTVVDGAVTWTDDGSLPTQGSFHVYAVVATVV